MKQTFVIQPEPHPARRRAMAALVQAQVGEVVTISDAPKKRSQEAMYHALIAEIADSTTYAGRKWEVEDMKRICIDEFAEEMRRSGTPLEQDSRIIPSEDGRRIIQLGVQSRHFTAKEASAFIDFLHAWAAIRETA